MAVSKTKAKLVDVARQLFAKMGVENTTMNDIALASKKGRRTLYTYFKSKEDIYMAVVESELDMLSDMMKLRSDTAMFAVPLCHAFGHDEACGGEEYIAGREDD